MRGFGEKAGRANRPSTSARSRRSTAARRCAPQYYGATIVRDRAAHRIVIFQDTLGRDFGSDPDLLVRQVERTLRHEVAHHLGYNEPGVAALGL